MLLWFTLGNYRSFKDKATLSLQATSSDELEDTNVYHKDGLRILKTAAIYGPNGGGKSNFLRGLSFMANFVKESATKAQLGDAIKVEPFLLNEETEKQPSYFEIAFKTQNITYQYGFEADFNEVKREWLYQTLNGKTARMFYREGMDIKPGRKFGANKQVQKMVRNNSLFLSVATQFNVHVANEVFQLFGAIKDMREFPIDLAQLGFAPLYDEKKYGSLPSEMLRTLGFQHERISADALPANTPLPKQNRGKGDKKLREMLLKLGEGSIYKLKVHHAKRDKNGAVIGTTAFDLSDNESLGTQKIMGFIPIIFVLSSSFVVLLVDEIESSLHPLLVRAALQMVHDRDLLEGGQMIFSTHDTNLLSSDLLRRDQVWLTPKNQFEESQLVSLVEYKVKKEHNMEKGYLEGRYGAIPYIGSMEPKIITPLNGKKTRKTAKKKS